MRESSNKRLAGLPVGRLVSLFSVLSIVPLALLAYFSLSIAGASVRREVEGRLRSTAAISAEVLRREMDGLAELVESYARRPQLIRAMMPADGRYDRSIIRFHLSQLRQGQSGIATTFVTDPKGVLIDISPATPSIVGTDFSFRDWYRGVTATDRPYVSEVYKSAATGNPRVVAAAAHVRGKPVAGEAETLGILVAAYSI